MKRVVSIGLELRCDSDVLKPAVVLKANSRPPRGSMTRPTGHFMAPSADLSAAADIRTGQSTDAIARALIDNLRCLQGKLPQHATRNDWYMALAYTVRDRMIDRYIRSLEPMTDVRSGHKVVAYLSAEFLVGPHLGNGLINLGIWDAAEQALAQFDQDLPVLLEQEEEPGLGQRRTRPARGLLHGLAGDAQRAGDRLRPPLRVRHLRSGDSRWLAGGDHRQVAPVRQPVGDRALGNHRSM